MTKTEFNQELFNELTNGLVYTPVFIPKSVSRNKKEKNPTINWVITLIRNGQSITTDYSMGTGCISDADKKAIKRAVGSLGSRSRQSMDQRRVELEMVEKGCIRSPDYFTPIKSKLDPPQLRDVVWSLLLDSDVLDHGSFEDWAANYGYETDSRKAEAIYRSCIEIGLKLRAMFGDATITKLRELFQDY